MVESFMYIHKKIMFMVDMESCIKNVYIYCHVLYMCINKCDVSVMKGYERTHVKVYISEFSEVCLHSIFLYSTVFIFLILNSTVFTKIVLRFIGAYS